LFDFPDPNETSEQRIATNVPLQQLFFLNSSFVQAQAAFLAQRLGERSPAEKVRQAYLFLLQRPPNTEELAAGLSFVAAAGNPWADYLQALLSSNEFIYLN
jgi:hypothetical protein